jgi:hypothetical protein
MGESYRPGVEDYRDSAEYDEGLENTEFGLVFKHNVSIAEYKAFARKFANKLGFLPESSPSYADYTRSLKRSREIATNLGDIDLSNIDIINFLREKAGFNSLTQKEYEALQNQATGVENSIEQPSTEEETVIPEGEKSNIVLEEDEVVNTESIDPAIESRIRAYPYPTRAANSNDYIRGFNLPEWLLINTETEQDILLQGIKACGVMPKLTDFPNYELIKAQRKINDISGEYLDFVNATRELYGLPAYGTSEEIVPEIPIDDKSVEQEKETNIEILEEQGPILENSTSLGNTNPINKEVIYHNRDEGLNTILDKYLPDDESAPESTAETVLQQALEQASATLEVQLATETEISAVDETIISKGEINSQELEKLKQEAHEAIAIYQQFGQEHPYHTRDRATQERYRELEAKAWEAQNKLAHMNGGEIFALPQKRDIELSHPEVKDTKDYLESQGYGFDEKGDIITITHHNKNIELNRPRSISDLIDKARPAHILTDINLDRIDSDLHHTGYVIPGLNPHTPDFIVSTLSNDEFIQGVIVEDTIPEQVPVTPVSEASPEVQETTSEVVASPEGEQSPINPDFGSLYYQEITLWNNIQALKERSKQKEAKDEDIDTQIEQAESDYQSFINTLGGSELGRNFAHFLDLRTESAYTEERNNEYGRDKNFLEKIRDKFSREDVSDPRELSPKEEEIKARNEYNQALQEFIKTQTAIGIESEVQQLFAAEVQRLRDERIVQSQELQEWHQTGLEKIANSTKEKLFNWYITHKNTIGKVNLALFATSTTLALTGAGLPVAGAFEAVRRTIAYPMALASGVSSRELIRSKFEDGDVNILNIIKYKGGITKLVGESLQGNYIQEAQDTELTAKLSTLESYYRLNGGKFTELSQQKAYELILTELGQRVENQKMNNIDTDVVQPEEQEAAAITGLEYNVNSKDNPIEQNPNYVNSLLETVSEKRITELQRLQRNRTIANVAGTVVAGSLLANLAVHAITPDNPDIADTPDNPSVGTSPETMTPNPTEISPAQPDIPSSEGLESMNEVAKEATQQLSTEQLQDISELSKGETLWGEVAEKLGANATEAQIQQGVETYMQSSQGSDTIFNLASQTEGGRALLVELGVDNAQELSQLSTEDLYNISKYLAPGQLQGLDSLDLQSIAEDTIDTSTMQPINLPAEEISIPTATPEQLFSKFTQAPDILDFPEGAKPLTQINNYIDRFAGDLSYDSSLGQEVLTTYLNTPEGKDWLYDAIVNNPERLSGNQNIQFVEEYFRQKGIKSGADINWVNLTQDKRFPTSMFWRETTLTGGRRIPPLSTLLKPGTMPGIKKALEQVLTLKQ